MNRLFKVIDIIDAQVTMDREIWNEMLLDSWHVISLYVGDALDLPICKFQQFGDFSFNEVGTFILAVKTPTGILYYHPLGCLVSEKKSLFDERIMVKLLTFAEEHVLLRKKSKTVNCDVFEYSLGEVSASMVSQMLKTLEITQEVSDKVHYLIERVKTEM